MSRKNKRPVDPNMAYLDQPSVRQALKDMKKRIEYFGTLNEHKRVMDEYSANVQAEQRAEQRTKRRAKLLRPVRFIAKQFIRKPKSQPTTPSNETQ